MYLTDDWSSKNKKRPIAGRIIIYYLQLSNQALISLHEETAGKKPANIPLRLFLSPQPIRRNQRLWNKKGRDLSYGWLSSSHGCLKSKLFLRKWDSWFLSDRLLTRERKRQAVEPRAFSFLFLSPYKQAVWPRGERGKRNGWNLWDESQLEEEKTFPKSSWRARLLFSQLDCISQ